MLRVLAALLLGAGLCLGGGAPAVAASSSASSGSGSAVTDQDPGSSDPVSGALSPEDVPGVEPVATSDAVAAAVKLAKSSGKAVEVAALTTATTLTYAEPTGEMAVRDDVLPQRVKMSGGWRAVSTSLRVVRGRLAPGAVPSDSVSFSDGSGPMAVISSGSASLALWWPGKLPVPAVSGSSAVYRDVFPGVSLVLTATSGAAGGFREVLVISGAKAARDPALRRLDLPVTAAGTVLKVSRDGALEAVARKAGGLFTAPAPAMWDSSRVLTDRALAGKAKPARASGVSVAGEADAVAAVSSQAGPGLGARMARVGDAVTDGGRVLSLAAPAAMLGAPGVSYPEYLDPDFSWSAIDGARQAYDDVQSSCPNVSHYNDSSYWSEGVGYEPDGCEGNSGHAYAYYRVAIPSAVHGGTVNAATVNAAEAYSGSCSASADVTLSWTNAMNSGTDWANMPSVTENVATDDVGPSTESCDGTYDKSSSAWKGVGFDVTSIGQKAAKDDWADFTFRLWESDDGDSDVYWKRFTPDPYIWIQYTIAPKTPSGLAMSTSTDGTVAECTSSVHPWVGELSKGGVTLSAVVKDTDGDELGGEFEYRTSTDGGTGWGSWTTPDWAADQSAAVASGQPLTVVMPYTLTNAMSDGELVEWTARAYNGDLYSGWAGTPCEFKVAPSAPENPEVELDTSGTIYPGDKVSLTVTCEDDSSADPATEVVFGLDGVPSDSDPSPSEVKSLADSSDSGGYATAATVTVTVPDAGEHAVYAYVKDESGAVSQVLETDDTGIQDPVTFSVASDPATTYADFADALDNQMISDSTAGSGDADADGAGNSIPETGLEAAGWEPSTSAAPSTVTADGATFTMPEYGSKANDNVLAANQVIDTPSDPEGNSLVFLVTATNADALEPDYSDLADYDSGDLSAPYIEGGTGVAGAACDTYQATQADPSCAMPEGTITYADGATSEYYLSVPDWVYGQPGAAVLKLPDRDSSGGTDDHPVYVYAISVPITPGEAIASVQLPDVGVEASGAAVHVLGIATADTATATPAVTTSEAASADGPWTGSWESPSEITEDRDVDGTAEAFDETTLRIVAHVSAAGSKLRLRLSDDLGWLHSGDGPLDVGAVTVAEGISGSAETYGDTAPSAVDFGDDDSTVTIPEGGDMYSDPVDMTVTAGETLDVSIYLDSDIGGLVENTMCDACTEYVTANGSGNDTGAETAADFTASGSQSGDFSNILTGIDTLTSGLPTVAVLGDDYIAGYGTSDAVSGVAQVTDDLASADDASFGVVSAGIEANSLYTDEDTAGDDGGPSALSRLARDILAEPGIGTVVLDEGLQDFIAAGGTSVESASDAAEETTGDAYTQLVDQLQAWGITVITTTLTPCDGYEINSSGDSCSTGTYSVDTHRSDFDQALDAQYDPASSASDCFASLTDTACSFVNDFSGAVSDGTALLSADNAGDDVNLTAAGYAALAATISSDELQANAAGSP